MNPVSRFILKPQFNNLSEQWLQYQDILTYVTIRSFYNSKDKYCYPSYVAIGKRSGFSKKFIAKSIKRLQNAKFLDVWKVGKNRVQHYYKFPEVDSLLKVPFTLFDLTDLNCIQKSMLLLFHEYCDSSLECNLSVAELTQRSGLTHPTISNVVRTLISKGYIAEDFFEDQLNGTLTKYLKLTDKVEWPSQASRQASCLKVESVESSSKDESLIDFAMKFVRKLRSEYLDKR